MDPCQFEVDLGSALACVLFDILVKEQEEDMKTCLSEEQGTGKRHSHLLGGGTPHSSQGGKVLQLTLGSIKTLKDMVGPGWLENPDST